MKKNIFILTGLMAVLFTVTLYGQIRDREKFFNDMINLIGREKEKYYKLISFGESARYSPDGKYIILQVKIEDRDKLFLFDRKTEKLVRGYWSKEETLFPVFNSKADTIYFYSSDQYSDKSYLSYVQEMDLEGKNRKLVLETVQTAEYLALSKDDKTLYYQEFIDSGRRLHKVVLGSLKGEVETDFIFSRVKGGGVIRDMTPISDGKRLLVLGAGYVYIYDTMNKSYSEIDPDMYNVVFSYNYTNYFYGYWSDHEDHVDKIYRINIKTSERKTLFSIKERKYEYRNFNLSPDGKKLLFTAEYKFASFIGTNVFFEMNMDGTGMRALPIDLSQLSNVPMVDIDKPLGVKKKYK